MLGELVVHAALVPELALIGRHDEIAAPAGDQLDLRLGEGSSDRGAQTGRLGLVVSDHAVFDRDVHAGRLPSAPQVVYGRPCW